MASYPDDARQVLHKAIADRVFPGAVANVGSSGGVLWHEPFGTLTFGGAVPVATTTPFDLASLTKVLVTTTVVMELVRTGRIRLDERAADCFPEWRGPDREPVTIQDLLEHASGLPARLVDAPPSSRREFEHEICTIRLEYAPREQSIYSDLGFILLGMLAEARGGRRLNRQFDAVRDALAATEPDLVTEPLSFELAAENRRAAAPTLPGPHDSRRGQTLVGEVHDHYAFALGGIAGHAGLFGTAAGVAAFARALLRAARGDLEVPAPLSPPLVRQFLAKSTMPGSSRALGWDTMLPTSSCGTHMSATAVGHVGFTGTSLWIDPSRDRYFVLLSNRVCGGGTLEAMRVVRRSFHDALAGF